MEHLAKDGPAALGFYKGLAGHDSSVVTSEHGIGYNVLKRQRSRAGLMQIPPQLEVVQPNWLPYVRVEDPAALAAKPSAVSPPSVWVMEVPSTGGGATWAVRTAATTAAERSGLSEGRSVAGRRPWLQYSLSGSRSPLSVLVCARKTLS